jgi:hypothetical protein
MHLATIEVVAHEGCEGRARASVRVRESIAAHRTANAAAHNEINISIITEIILGNDDPIALKARYAVRPHVLRKVVTIS